MAKELGDIEASVRELADTQRSRSACDETYVHNRDTGMIIIIYTGRQCHIVTHGNNPSSEFTDWEPLVCMALMTAISHDHPLNLG